MDVGDMMDSGGQGQQFYLGENLCSKLVLVLKAWYQFWCRFMVVVVAVEVRQHCDCDKLPMMKRHMEKAVEEVVHHEKSEPRAKCVHDSHFVHVPEASSRTQICGEAW